MKTNLTTTKLTPAFGIASQLLSRVALLGAVILICSSAFAQNLFVSGNAPQKNCPGGCGVIFEFTWDAVQSIYAWGLIDPWDVVFDSAGNLFVVDYDRDKLFGEAAVYKITRDGRGTIFATGLSHLSHLACDKTGNLFVADYDDGVIYIYKPNGSRATFATGLYHPAGMAFDSTGILFVADNSTGNIRQGGIYLYQPNGSRSTFAVLAPSDHPTDLAFDGMGNLFMADQAGNIYKYDLGSPMRRHPGRTTFGSVPGNAQSLAFDSAGNLLVVDAGGVNGIGSTEPNAIYKFTQQGARTAFASAEALGERFSQLGFEPMSPSSP